jgi:lipoic acid synthetase
MAAETRKVVVKSGLMVGLGETLPELYKVFSDLKSVGVEYLTIGQYLRPSGQHYQVVRYYHPSEFDELAERAQNLGITSVFSAPLVRSSYHAGARYNS